jgi:CheY-like chemotaxis protein
VTTETQRVLVVDDDEDFRSMVSWALADAGYDAVEAADGSAALVACQERDPAVILLDLAMPGVGGQAFADAYRRGQGRAKIIVISGASSGGEISARMQASVFISKPFEVENLLVAVRRMVSAA